MKIRTGYVSNSSSTSFIMDSPGRLEEFYKRNFSNISVYYTDDVKEWFWKGYEEFRKYISEHSLSYDNQGDALEYIWSEFLSGHVPDWIEWTYLPRYWDQDISRLIEEIDSIPSGKYLTSGIDRDHLYEEFGVLQMPVAQGIDVFMSEV